MNLKRLAFIMFCSVAAAKMVTVVIVRLAENSDLTSHALGRNFLQDSIDGQMKVAPTSSRLNITKFVPRAPIYKFSGANGPIMPIAAPPVVAAAEKKDPKAEADKKEKERRKKRKKKLEEAKDTSVATTPKPETSPIPAASLPVAHTYAPAAGGFSFAKTETAASPVASNTVTTTPVTTGRPASTSSSALVTRWQTLLTTAPTAALMTSFEGLYTSHAITEAQFYQVLTAMQTSTNSEARNFAVQGANLYKDIYSFKLLADESQSSDTVAAVKTAAQTDVAAYKAQTYASILQQALATGDSAEKVVAAQLLATAATTGQVPGATQATMNELASILGPLSNDPNAEIRRTALQALTGMMQPYHNHNRTN